MFPLTYFILFLWSFTSLLYAIIKRDEVGIQAFVILTPNLYIALSNIIHSYNFLYLLIGIL